MSIEKYADLWQDKSNWFLESIPETGSYIIMGYNDRGLIVTYDIEDDDIYEAVCQKMIEEGSKILTRDEVNQLMPPPPSDFNLKEALRALRQDEIFPTSDD